MTCTYSVNNAASFVISMLSFTKIGLGFLLNEFSIDQNCFLDQKGPSRLHSFCDALNVAYCCVVYLHCIVNGELCFCFGEILSGFYTSNNLGYLTKKKLEAAKMVVDLDLMLWQHFVTETFVHFWTDSQVILK